MQKRICLEENLANFPKVLTVNKPRKAYNLLWKVLLTTSQTLSDWKKNNFLIDSSSLNKQYAEPFSYPPVQSDVTLNITELPKDTKLTAEGQNRAGKNWKLRKVLELTT